MANTPRIGVVGSANVDLTFRTPRLPRPGETLAGHTFHLGMGGKGANQAVAAARLGANVSFVARIGNDAFGQEALRRYQNEGIDTIFVETDTDLPTGTTYYPADNAEAKDPRVSNGPGVMLASYSWGQQARRLAALPHTQREALVLRQLSRVHPQLLKPAIIRQTASWSWDNHPYSSGAFAWFTPGQHTALYRYVIAPEGRIYFAGEHASLTHTWMQGALESGMRAVQQMLEAAQKG